MYIASEMPNSEIEYRSGTIAVAPSTTMWHSAKLTTSAATPDRRSPAQTARRTSDPLKRHQPLRKPPGLLLLRGAAQAAEALAACRCARIATRSMLARRSAATAHECRNSSPVASGSVVCTLSCVRSTGSPTGRGARVMWRRIRSATLA